MRRKTEKAENFWRRNFFCEDKEKGEGKGRRYLEKENVIFVEEKKTEKEIEENIWRRKIYFFAEKKGKGGEYLEKENILFAGEKKNREGEGENILDGENVTMADTQTVVCLYRARILDSKFAIYC